MSYEIVQSISIKEDSLGFFYASITSASNNVTPRYKETWTYAQNQMLSKEELIKCILLDYWNGNLQKGSNVFRLTCNVANGRFKDEIGERYYKLSKVCNKLCQILWCNKRSKEREEEYSKLYSKLHEEKERCLKDFLYTYYLVAEKIKGVYVKEKNSDFFPYYVSKINSGSYRISTDKVLLTSKPVIGRVLSEPKGFWKNNFDVEVVYKN